MPPPSPCYITARMLLQSLINDVVVNAGGASKHELGQVQEDCPRAG